jgi:hypothetical protein
MAEYKPTCSLCHVYPSSKLSGDRGICLRCLHQVHASEDEQAQKQQKREIEAIARELLRDQPEPKPRSVVYCGSCLSSLGVISEVDRETNRGICARCKGKSQPQRGGWNVMSYASYTPRMTDRNKIY